MVFQDATGITNPDYTPDSQFGLVDRSLHIYFEVAREITQTENSRTVLRAPQIMPVSRCPLLPGRQFLAYFEHKLGGNACQAAVPPIAQTLQLPVNSAVRFDYSSVAPESNGQAQWDLTSQTNAVNASYVDLQGEGAASRRLFLSATFIGLASAAGPLGLEKIAESGWLQTEPRNSATP